MLAEKSLGRDNINLKDYLIKNDKDSLTEIIQCLSANGQLTKEELDGITYALDVLFDEFNDIDISNYQEYDLKNLKDQFNHNKIDVFSKLYSRLLSMPSSFLVSMAGAGAAGVVVVNMFTLAAAGIPLVSSITKYSKYAEKKKYAEESMVRQFERMNGIGWLKTALGSQSWGRMDAYNRNLNYFEQTTSRRASKIKRDNDSEKLLKGLKSFIGIVIDKGLNFLMWHYRGSGITNRVRKAEKEFYKVFKSSNEVKQSFETIHTEMYNEYISTKMEDYAKKLVDERIKLILKHRDLKKRAEFDYSNVRLELKITENITKLRDNKRELEKISTLEGVHAVKNEAESIYYSGISKFTKTLLKNETDIFDISKDINGKYITAALSIVGKNRRKHLDLEKKKSLLRLMTKELPDHLSLKKLSNNNLIKLKKVYGLILAGEEPIEIIYRVRDVTREHYKDNDTRFIADMTNYSNFIYRFFDRYETYKKKDIETEQDLDNLFEQKVKEIKTNKSKRFKI